MSDMKEDEIQEIDKNYENMKKQVSAWVDSCGQVPSDMKRAIEVFEAASTESAVVKRRSMSTVRGDYRVMLNLIQIGVIDRVYEHPDEEFNFKMRTYDLKQAENAGLIANYSVNLKDKTIDVAYWPPLFPTRNRSLVDSDTETVIAEVVKARTDMAALIESNSIELKLTNDEVDILNSSNWYDYEKEEMIKQIDKSDLDAIDMIVTKLQKYHNVIEAWAKTLVLETKPLSSITPDNHNLSFGNTVEILSQNAPVSKLRQYRRAFDEKMDNKNDDGVQIARHKVKWSGKLEDAPVINYTPVKRAKKGESKK